MYLSDETLIWAKAPQALHTSDTSHTASNNSLVGIYLFFPTLLLHQDHQEEIIQIHLLCFLSYLSQILAGQNSM